MKTRNMQACMRPSGIVSHQMKALFSLLLVLFHNLIDLWLFQLLRRITKLISPEISDGCSIRSLLMKTSSDFRQIDRNSK